jgi:hypothetical protein
MPGDHAQEWERRLLGGCREEWEVARQGLPAKMARALRPPSFELCDMGSLWGRWEGGPVRRIQLSRKLVWDHPWYAVVEVLRHEMAHQLAEEILGAQGESPHGPTFRQACQWLRTTPRASDSYPTLDQHLASSGGGEEDRMQARVRKLLALAESPNQHEAELALAKAQELMARHNIELHERSGVRNYLSIRLGRCKKRHARDAYVLAGILGEFYLVQPIWVPGYDPRRDAAGTVLEISGEAANVRLAHYVYDYLRHYCDSQWAQFSRNRKLGRTARRDFSLGILMAFAEKLRQTVEEAAPEIQALVRSGDPELNQYVAERYPQLRTRRSSALRCHPEALAEGQKRGRDLSIHPGVETGQPARRLGSGK